MPTPDAPPPVGWSEHDELPEGVTIEGGRRDVDGAVDRRPAVTAEAPEAAESGRGEASR